MIQHFTIGNQPQTEGPRKLRVAGITGDSPWLAPRTKTMWTAGFFLVSRTKTVPEEQGVGWRSAPA